MEDFKCINDSGHEILDFSDANGKFVLVSLEEKTNPGDCPGTVNTTMLTQAKAEELHTWLGKWLSGSKG